MELFWIKQWKEIFKGGKAQIRRTRKKNDHGNLYTENKLRIVS